jgi:hypothetical protein
MNVQQLIDMLNEYPKDSMVVVNGYEGGVSEVGSMSECRLRLNVNTAWYYGCHEMKDDGDTPAVWIGG